MNEISVELLATHPQPVIGLENDALAETWLLGWRRLQEPRFGQHGVPTGESGRYGRLRQPWIHQLASGCFEVDIEVFLNAKPLDGVFGWSTIEYHRNVAKPTAGPLVGTSDMGTSDIFSQGGVFSESIDKEAVFLRSEGIELQIYYQGLVAFGERLHVSSLVSMLRGRLDVNFMRACGVELEQREMENMRDHVLPKDELGFMGNRHQAATTWRMWCNEHRRQGR